MTEPLGSPQQYRPRLSALGLVGGAVIAWLLLLAGLAAIAVVVYLVTDREVAAVAEQTVTLQLSEFEIQPDVVQVEPGTDVTLVAENVGEIQHNLFISETTGTERLNPGDSAVLEAGVAKESYVVWCAIKGHRENGMEAVVEVATGFG